MTLRRACGPMSAPPFSRLPRLDSTLDRRTLARPERREATARLRRDWQESRRPRTDVSCVPPNLPLRNSSSSVEHTHEQNTETAIPAKLTLDEDIWQAEVSKRDIPERPLLFRHLTLSAIPVRRGLSEPVRYIAPMFNVAPDHTRTDKHKRRIHFINKDWSSENVSWRRFVTNVSEYHRRSWLE